MGDDHWWSMDYSEQRMNEGMTKRVNNNISCQRKVLKKELCSGHGVAIYCRQSRTHQRRRVSRVVETISGHCKRWMAGGRKWLKFRRQISNRFFCCFWPITLTSNLLSNAEATEYGSSVNHKRQTRTRSSSIESPRSNSHLFIILLSSSASHRPVVSLIMPTGSGMKAMSKN